MSTLGDRVVRTRDQNSSTTAATDVDDLPLKGAVHVADVRSPMAHARIRSIDLAEARSLGPRRRSIPSGRTGIRRPGTMGSTPALRNAMIDALSAPGVRHADIPATPIRVWTAVERARSN